MNKNVKVGNWAKEFKRTRGFNPMMIDMWVTFKDSHVKSQSIREPHTYINIYNRAKEICEEKFEEGTWYISNDLYLWVDSDEQLMIFNICWDI